MQWSALLSVNWKILVQIPAGTLRRGVGLFSGLIDYSEMSLGVTVGV